jgi:hypothetical protein
VEVVVSREKIDDLRGEFRMRRDKRLPVGRGPRFGRFDIAQQDFLQALKFTRQANGFFSHDSPASESS